MKSIWSSMNDPIDPKYTRVSQILSIFQHYAHVPTAKLKKAQDIGTDIHSAIEDYWRNGFQPVRSSNLPYFESFLQWAEEHHPNPIIFEQRFNDPTLLITGRIDLLAHIEGLPYLIDFKTGSWSHPEIWELQMCFYRHLLSITKAPSVPNRFAIVHLSKEGLMPSLTEFTYDPKLWDVCLGAIDCYRFFSNRGGFDLK